MLNNGFVIIGVQSNYAILAHNKLSLTVIHMTKIFIINCFVKGRGYLNSQKKKKS